MNKEEAIICLQGLLENPLINKGSYLAQAIEMAIQALEKENIYDDGEHYVTISKALYDKLNTDYEALSQEPCDAISRDAVLQAVSEGCQEWRGIYGRCEELINALPSVNPQPSEHFIDGVHAMGYREGYKDAQKQKSGKWIKVKSGDKDFPESIVCSRCSNENSHLDFNENAEPIGKVFVTSKFCPNCGAKMESEG